MSSLRSPVFPMLQQQHFSDYGFDPQIDYFQILQEARKQKTEAALVDETLQSRLQKRIKKRKWWRSVVSFWKWRRRSDDEDRRLQQQQHYWSRRAFSGLIYDTDSGSSTPSRSGRPSSGPLAGSWTPSRKGDLETPYLNLREINLDRRISSSPLPVYFVT